MNLKLTKKSILIFAFSMASLLGMAFRFNNSGPFFDYLDTNLRYYEEIRIFAWIYIVSLIAINFFSFMGREDFTKLSTIVNVGAVLIMDICELFGIFGGRFDMINLRFGAYLLTCLSFAIAYVVTKYKSE